ncbi:glutamate receptor ionotropic, delta-1 [Trichonephila clavata]|uniref:Glutamate receptor ionotropic, delta-1 n=1 Tax=Trichonephila clavata TaxID=2740835 RepID=A0A8X6KD49_TRICU|nr:glutamate receptor ionotropic, delta-1 [Trichonephila clavata]
MHFGKWIVAALNTSKMFEVQVNENGKKRIAGIEGKFADAIFTKMNIEYDIVFPEDNEFGHEINGGNWTGVVGMVQRGEADLGIATLGINENRFRVVDFSFPYTTDRLTFAVLKPSEWLTGFGFFNLLDLPTWILLFGSFLLSSALFFAMLKATPSKAAIIKNFRELSKAVERGTHRVYTGKGTFAVPFFLNSKELYFRLLGNEIERNNWYMQSEEMVKNPLKSTDTILVAPSEILKFLFGNQPRIFISEDSSYTISTAIVIRKDFCCKTQLRKVMSRVVSAGIYERYFNLESFRYSLSLPGNEIKRDEERILTLNHLYGAFSMLLAGLVVSFLVFVGEVISHKLCVCSTRATQKHS